MTDFFNPKMKRDVILIHNGFEFFCFTQISTQGNSTLFEQFDRQMVLKTKQLVSRHAQGA